MTAYQMIYTACGKDKSGAFSVWAKSACISKNECDEIIKLMNYRKPKNAPYEPTEAEIEALFPKKYGYFKLSSGKKCIAQSTYIGKVYSDMDGRSGNFIIHAYVFESLDAFNPYNIFNCNAFKTKLSYKEWHDAPLPDDLPAVELNQLPLASEADFRAAVSKYSSVLPAFLEAVLRAYDGDKIIVFNDTEANQVKLYTALGILLPNNILERLTFSTQYAAQAEFSLQTVGAIPVKLRNMFDGGVGSQYGDGDASDRYVFDFEKNALSNINGVRRYASDIIGDAQTSRYFDLIKKVDLIGSIMAKADCDIDTANAIYNLCTKNYDWFNTIDDFNNALSAGIKTGFVNGDEVAYDVFNNIIKRGKWNIDGSLLPLIGRIYTLSNSLQRKDIIGWFCDRLDDFVRGNQNAQTYLTAVKNALPFSWEDFASYILSDGRTSVAVARSMDFCKSYLFYNVFIFALKTGQGDAQSVGVNIISIVKRVITARDADRFAVLLDAGKQVGAPNEKWLMDNAATDIFNPAVDEAALQFGFEVINKLYDESVKAQCMEKFLYVNIKSPYLLPVYMKHYEYNRSLYERIESKFAGIAEFKAFIAKKEAYLFSKEARPTPRMLDNYFNKFYVTGYDSGVYLSKLKSYLSGLQGTERVKECLRQYNQVKNLGDSFCDVLAIIDAVEEKIYSVPIGELLKLNAADVEVLSDIDCRQKRNRRTTSGRYEILQILQRFSLKFDKSALDGDIQQGSVYNKLSPSQLTYLAENHADAVLNAYFAIKKEKKHAKSVLLNSLFAPLFVSVGKIDRVLPVHLTKSKNYYDFMADIFEYAFNQQDAFANSLQRFIKTYVDSMNRGDYKKLFKNVREIIDDKSLKAVDKYIDDYLDKHKSFLESIFGRKNKGGND